MRRRPIGQILVEKGEISEVDLEAALAEQERTGRRLGEILIEQGRTSWLALARAIAEQVLDIQSSEDEPEPVRPASPDPVAMVRDLAERVANLPPVPDPPAAEERHLLKLTPAPHPDDSPERLLQIEALLKERQRAFIELVTTAETLRMKVARLEEILDERDRELTRLRVARAS